MKMTEPSLKFIEELYTPEEINSLMEQFREDGYVILRDVLKEETVDPFVQELESIMFNDGCSWRLPDDSLHYMHLANTPRGYQVLAPALSRTAAQPFPSLHTTMIIIQKGADDSYIPDWHKDREPEGMPDGEYHFPLDVFLGFYLEDMTDEQGPTLVLPGSHRDSFLTPWNDDAEPVAIYCRKQDALLLDQRVWHRGTARKAPGNRFLMIYGYYAMPHFYGTTFKMPRSQRSAWVNAESMRERILFGGPFSPPDQDDLLLSENLIKERTSQNKPIYSSKVAY